MGYDSRSRRRITMNLGQKQFEKRQIMANNASSSTSSSKDDKGVVCDCNRPAKIVRAWTDANTGRRFYSCTRRKMGNGYESCNYFRWFYEEKQHGWQHLALLEARDVIREQKEEIRNLKQEMTFKNAIKAQAPSDILDELKQTREDCEALKREVLILKEKSTVQYLMSLE